MYIILVFFFSVHLGIKGATTWIHYNLTSKKSVVLSKEDSRIKVFYREDCKSCQQLYPQLYWHNVWYQDLLFVNLSVPANRKYIQEYQLKKVPTFVFEKKRLISSEKEEVFSFIRLNK
ncbi:hypothetical protein IGK80_001131 [Enterococcus sp. DIV0609]|uniref:thioredoxin domain-containing protein n=1 Tax=unclassified Enterococcus TaxID=2608891 RepID=UPI003F2034BF